MSYYRLVVNNDVVSVLEDYDYSDYCTDNFLRDPDDDEVILRFSTEYEAIRYLNEKIKEEHIHPKWRKPDLKQSYLFK